MLDTLRRAYRALPLDHRTRARVRSVLRRIARLTNLWGSRVYQVPSAEILAPRDPRKPDYVFFSLIDWHFRIQRPQHLAREMVAAGHRCFYVSSELIEHPRPGFRVGDLGGEGRLFQVRLHGSGSPSIYFSTPSRKIGAQLAAGLRDLLEWAQVTHMVLLVQHPFWLSIARSVPREGVRSKLVYDCMDYHDGFDTFADSLRDAEQDLIRSADLTVVTSVWLRDFVAPNARQVALVRNAAEYAHFAIAPAHPFRDAKGRAVIGYYGALAEWFDVDLVRAVAKRFSDALVLLVGHDQAHVERALDDLPNVRFIGEVSYGDLPHFLHGFDVCLLPFRLLPLTLATNPVKLYEYLSAGKPVVSVDLPEARECAGLVRVAKGPDEFLVQVRQALEGRGDGEGIAARQAYAATQTWRERGRELERAIEGTPWAD